MGQKNTFFEKQSGEVIENKGKGYIDSQKQTEKQSGEVVENTFLWKKQTENKPDNQHAQAENRNRAWIVRNSLPEAW